MGLTIADTYYLKAKAAVYYDWEEVCESLNYALSYNEDHCAALCLLGKVYAKNLKQYDLAFECFDKVIAIDSSYVQVYIQYGKFLIWTGEIERATKLISFAFTVKGISKGELHWLSAYAFETKQEYKLALKELKEAKKHTYNYDYFSFLEDEINRIKKKQKLDEKNCFKKETKAEEKEKMINENIL